jgi:hypothetical protein
MHELESSHAVEFTWNSRHYVVTQPLEVFELKGKTLMITGSSILMQNILRSRQQQNRNLDQLMETLKRSEGAVRSDKTESLSQLLEAKTQLSKLVPQKKTPIPRSNRHPEIETNSKARRSL